MIDSNAYYVQVRTMLDDFMEKYGIGVNKMAYLMGMEPHHLNNMKARNNWNPSIAWLDKIPPRLQRAEIFMQQFTKWAVANGESPRLDLKSILQFAVKTATPEYEALVAEVDEKHKHDKQEKFREYAREKAAASKIQGPGAIVTSSPSRGILTPEEFVESMVKDLEKR